MPEDHLGLESSYYLWKALMCSQEYYMSQTCPGLCQLLPLTVACSHRQGNWRSTESGICKLGHRMLLTSLPWGCVCLRGHIKVEVGSCKLTLVPHLKSGSSSASSPVPHALCKAAPSTPQWLLPGHRPSIPIFWQAGNTGAV